MSPNTHYSWSFAKCYGLHLLLTQPITKNSLFSLTMPHGSKGDGGALKHLFIRPCLRRAAYERIQNAGLPMVIVRWGNLIQSDIRLRCKCKVTLFFLDSCHVMFASYSSQMFFIAIRISCIATLLSQFQQRIWIYNMLVNCSNGG